MKCDTQVRQTLWESLQKQRSLHRIHATNNQRLDLCLTASTQAALRPLALPGFLPIAYNQDERAEEPTLCALRSDQLNSRFPPFQPSQLCLTMRGSVQNIISPDTAGYIRKERLEARLRTLFGYTITVRVSNF
jgi:hypothetical protein